MQFFLIDHSFLSHVAYDSETETLTIVFRRGEGRPPRVYNYLGVPDLDALELIESPNPGAHFQRNLRAVYTYEEIGAPELATTLGLAKKLGYERFAVSRRNQSRLDIDQVIAADPDAVYHGDDDCGGNHMWFLGGPAEVNGREQRPIWHLNTANGQVVPPTPRIVERS